MPVQINSEVEWLRTCFRPSRESFPTWLRLYRYASFEVKSLFFMKIVVDEDGHGSEITSVEGRRVECHGGTSVS
jgi:hypothetical protein